MFSVLQGHRFFVFDTFLPRLSVPEDNQLLQMMYSNVKLHMTPSCLGSVYNPNKQWVAWYLPCLLEFSFEYR